MAHLPRALGIIRQHHKWQTARFRTCRFCLRYRAKRHPTCHKYPWVVLGFGMAAASLVFLQFGTQIPVTHHIVLPAAVAAAASGSIELSRKVNEG